MSPRTSTCSQGSAASPSPRKPRASKPSRSAKKTADAASSSSEPGACPSTTTLTPSTVGNTEELPLFLEGLHASPPVVPGSKAARATTAGSGRRLFAFCSSQRRTHLFTRTLLGSSTWRSTENLLRWEVTGLPSEITEIFSLVQDPASSSKSWAKSKRVVTRSSRSLFLLVPSTARNSGCEFGSLDSEAIEGDESSAPWPTPTTDADRNRTKKYAQGGTPLNMLVNQTSWPTPNARDTKSEEVSPEYAEERNAETRGQTLSWVAARTWPAPTATDQTRAGSPETDEDKKARGAKVGTSLTDAVAKANWPTPNTGDSERSGKRPSRGSRTGGYISEVTPATWPTPQVHQGPNNSENRGSAHGGNRRRLTPQNPKDLMANWPTPRTNTGTEGDGWPPSDGWWGDSVLADPECLRRLWRSQRPLDAEGRGWFDETLDAVTRLCWEPYEWTLCSDDKVRRTPVELECLDHGVHRSILAALGNAVVPQLVFRLLLVIRNLIHR
jgi:hypothetical protein